MKQFAVIGDPIAHSKSPDIHSAFAAQFGIQLTYTKLLADKQRFVTITTDFLTQGVGVNITLPFKEDALRVADELSDDAKRIGAVNTLTKKNGLVKGANTDGVGLVRDIRDNYGVEFTNKKVLVIGAGGASKGIILPIARENPQLIMVVNRTDERAVLLAKQFADYAKISAITFDELKTAFDIVINATSASLSGQKLALNPDIFAKTTLAYDMMYGAKPTPFMQLASQHGAMAVDGLGMLVEQAAESFNIWHGVLPDTKSVISQIRAMLLVNS
ncbi:MAG: shikimate dehydrogenase [Ostreibacterium sp.]